ncbi:hypothetical protein BJV82DRAFT_666743 [Fennellomyces sp. T-0311]|nr:hypothetical protein BJV82DRAFT_666743 [Fennellomyces sp. T-0311]
MTGRSRRPATDGLLQLVGKSYDAYRCTDFYGFRTDRRSRHSYEEGITAALCTVLRLEKLDQDSKKKSQSANEINGYLESVQVNLYPIEGWDSPYTPIEIVVRVKFKRNTAPVSESKIIMLPIREQPEADVLCSYPLLLVRAKSVVWKTASLWVKKAFDCHIVELQVKPNTLVSIVEWWSSRLFETPPGESDAVTGRGHVFNKFELEFQVPNTTGISTFTLSMSISDLMSLYGVAKASKTTLIEVIRAHIYSTMKVKLAAFILVRIGTPVVYLDINKSKLKLFTNTSKALIVRVLEDLCEAIIQERIQNSA